MRKSKSKAHETTYERFQVQSSLEKAEKSLEEAIERVKMESKYPDPQDSEAQKAVEEAMSAFKKAVLEEQQKEGLKENSGIKPLYGYAPEFSSPSKIDRDIGDIDEEKKGILTRLLGEEALQEHENEEALRREELLKQDLLNEEFHDGYDSLVRIAEFNRDLNKTDDQPKEKHILNESEDYEMKCFNEKNVFEDESYEYEADDIMPTNFFLHSFDEEEEEKIEPYDINEALVLGEVIPPDHLSEDLPPESGEQEAEAQNEEGDQEEAESSEEPPEINREELEAAKAAILEEARKQAQEMLADASAESEKLIEEAKQQAQKLIEETVQKATEEASDKGFAEGYKKGQNEGYMAAENAINEGMIQEAAAFREELEASLKEFEERKEEILGNSLNDLTDLAVNIAEKVIKISLRSSKDVVAKMIVAAAEDCRDKQWAKVYISQDEKALAMNLEKELIDALNQISSNVKVVVMEDEPSGTCIIESPDQIVDASVGTQLDNIRQIVSDNRT